MKKEVSYFPANLRFLREKQKMEQETLAKRLGRKSSSSVSDWEKGKYTPKSGILNDIASIFNVSLSELMNSDLSKSVSIEGDNKGLVMGSVDNHGDVSITNNDMDTSAMEAGQKLSLKSSDALLELQTDGADVRSEILEVLKDIKKDQRKLIAEVKRLNTSSEAHIEPVSDFIEVREELYPYQVYERLSAGIGSAVWDDGSFDTVYFDKELSHDIASWVYGDSMEPTFLDGEVALIRANGYDYDGAVYAVVWDGRTYIKRVYKEEDGLRLVSLNPKYRDLFAPFEEEPRIIGLVVGHFMPEEN